jgi:hypothetical protein
VISFDSIRQIALQLPEVEESTTYNDPAFRVRGKLFLHLDEDGDILHIRLGRDEKHAIAAADPERFFINPRNPRSPKLATRLSTNDEKHLPELAELIEDAWRRYAPSRLVKSYGAARAVPSPPARQRKARPTRRP